MSPRKIRSAALAWISAMVLALAAASGDLSAQGPRRARLGWQPHLGLHAGVPQGASVALGLMRPVWWTSDFTSMGGPRLVVEPGLRAGKLRVGYARTGAFAVGYAVEAVVVREWGRGGHHDLPSTGYGVELHGSGMFLDLGVGAYRRASGVTRLSLSAGLVL